MKILKSLLYGAKSTCKIWNGVLITWLFSLLLVLTLTIPLKGAIKSAFGSSMITEKLADGFNFSLLTDIGPAMKVIISYFSAGFLLLMIAGFIMNIFLAGGLFTGLRRNRSGISSSEFFGAAAKNFWSFLIISALVRLILNFLTGISIAVPLIIISTSENISFNTSVILASIGGLLSIIIIPVMILVADYSRAWQASNEKSACFKALGFGFSHTFSTFWSSYPMMLILILVQILFMLGGFLIISDLMPSSGIGVFLFFLLSQLLFFVRLMLKVWRYGSVTALMEVNREKSDKQ